MLMTLCQQKGLTYAINGREPPWPLKVYFREMSLPAPLYKPDSMILWSCDYSSEVAAKSSIRVEKKFHLS